MFSSGLSQRLFVRLIDRVLPFRSVELVDAGGVGFLHFAADDLHRAVDHAVLLCERFRKDRKGGRQPAVGEEGRQVAPFAKTDMLKEMTPHSFLASFIGGKIEMLVC